MSDENERALRAYLADEEAGTIRIKAGDWASPEGLLDRVITARLAEATADVVSLAGRLVVAEARVQAAMRELCDTSRDQDLRISRGIIALGEGGPDLLVALDRDRAQGLYGPEHEWGPGGVPVGEGNG